MITIDAQQTAAGLSDLSAAVRNAIVASIKASVDEAARHARATTLYVTHTPGTGLRAKTTGESFGTSGKVVADTAYAGYVESGTPPHVIRPKNAQMLRFVKNGTVVFRRSVNHPGTAERPFMQQARDHGEQVLSYGADYMIDEAVKRA